MTLSIPTMHPDNLMKVCFVDETVEETNNWYKDDNAYSLLQSKAPGRIVPSKARFLQVTMFHTNRISLHKYTTWSLGSKLTHQVNSHIDQQILWQKDNYVLSALSNVVIDKPPVKRSPPKRRDQQK